MLLLGAEPIHTAPRLPLIDAHIHYSHDAWRNLPPGEAIAALRRAKLAKAFVSSSGDDGTQMLYAIAPNLVVPVLRPYRRRGELSSWFRDSSVITMLEERLERFTYLGIGEFHIFGEDADSPVFRQVVELARRHGLFLHAHSDTDAVHRIFAQYPEGIVLWAHAGFESPGVIRSMLGRYDRLWADLAFRTEHAAGGNVDPTWHELFMEFPDRFMIGTDTFTPERWYFVEEHAAWSREWLGSLPLEIAERIAWKNAAALVSAVRR